MTNQSLHLTFFNKVPLLTVPHVSKSVCLKVIPFTIPVAASDSIHVQEDRLPHFYPHLHRHQEIQITLILSGEGTLIAGNSMHPFQSGNIYIIGANQPHLFKSTVDYFKKNRKKKIHSLNIFFNPAGDIANLLNLPELNRVKLFLNSTAQGKQAAQDNDLLMKAILKVGRSARGFRMAAFLELLQVMADIKKWKPLSTGIIKPFISDLDGLRMNDVYQYTITHYSHNISLSEVAAVIHLTPHSFCRYFKKHTSKTYIQFLHEVRISEACRILMESKFKNIADVAFQTGFNQVVTFNRVFRSVRNCSPKQFIKEYRSTI
jgi:AraC-like DNA-binding protein